jgi:hypothetical protein
MEHTEQLDRVPQVTARTRQAALIVRTGVRAGAEEVNPGPTTPTTPAMPAMPAMPEAANTITMKLDDLVKMLQCFGSSA